MIRQTGSQSICGIVLQNKTKQKNHLGKIKTWLIFYISGNTIISKDINSLNKIPGATRQLPKTCLQVK